MNAAARHLISFLLFVPALPTYGQLLPPDSSWAERTLRGMTLDEKLGQLFMPVHFSISKSRDYVERYHVGGLWFARSEARKIAEEFDTLQDLSRCPLLFSADFEKGAGTYVDGATDLPNNMALGASRNPALAYRAAALTAREARAIGVRVNFAPVMDVNNNPKNPIINVRSYGEDPKLVAQMAEAAISGYQENGLLATGKHFPGHGNTGIDTHAQLGVVESSPSDFESIELLPYKEVVRKTNLADIMSAHLWIKAVDTDTVPATLSPHAMKNLLRERLGFEGVVYTDAMEMGGISRRYSAGDATVKALQAGCDVILFPVNIENGLEGIRAALQTGQITQERIDESVRRILLAKTKVGLHKNCHVNLDRIPSLVGTAENYAEAKRIAAGCLTLVKDEKNLLPIDPTRKIAVITITNKEGNSMQSRGLVSFPDEVKKHAPIVLDVRISERPKEEEIAAALDAARRADIIVLAAYIRIVIASGIVELPPPHAEAVRNLVSINPKAILVSFGNPYIVSSVPEVPTYICAYDNARAMQEVAAEALFGKTPFVGRLPVTISETMKYGDGVTKN